MVTNTNLTNIVGPLVPDIIKGFDLSLTMVALLIFAFFIAYGIVSIPAGILLEKYFVSKFPIVILKEDEKADALKVYLDLFKNPYVILFFAGILCYVGTEQVVANWISQFLYVYHQYDPQTTGAKAVAYFWGQMTAGGALGLILLKIINNKTIKKTHKEIKK